MKIFSRNEPLLIILLVTIISFTCYRCIATSNSYTARTLEKKQIAFSPGFDYIAILNHADIQRSKKAPFLPALGIHYGLTNQLELGLRGFMPYTLEAIARYQLSPRNFKFFDLSANLHCGSYKIKYLPYLKSGFLIGKKVWFFEPFVGIYWYDPFEREYGNSRAINFGFGFPWKGATVIPEINWQFGKSNIKDGIGFFSIGFRMWK